MVTDKLSLSIEKMYFCITFVSDLDILLHTYRKGGFDRIIKFYWYTNLFFFVKKGSILQHRLSFLDTNRLPWTFCNRNLNFCIERIVFSPFLKIFFGEKRFTLEELSFMLSAIKIIYIFGSNTYNLLTE